MLRAGISSYLRHLALGETQIMSNKSLLLIILN